MEVLSTLASAALGKERERVLERILRYSAIDSIPTNAVTDLLGDIRNPLSSVIDKFLPAFVIRSTSG